MNKLRIACIGNYVPRQCGIATFTRDLVESLTAGSRKGKHQAEVYVAAMNDHNNVYDYPPVVKYQIRDTHQKDYLETVKLINFSNADVCILQHEYGIYGGENGIYLLPMIRRLTKPLVTVLHTVLKNPSYNAKSVIQEIDKRSEKLVVMSRRAVDFLTDSYGIKRDKIAVIEHGVPDFDFRDKAGFKKKLNLIGKKSLFTFGLLSRDKGIETVLNALPMVKFRHPEILYIVMGKTHPSVVRNSGEEYRNYLISLVKKNSLKDNVVFFNRFATNEELFNYLDAADIYVIPNLNKAQITSGTLSYAIGSGAAVVSTRFWHAQELLADGRGRLFNFSDSHELSEILNELLSKPELLNKIRIKAYNYGSKMRWPLIGSRYLELLSDALLTWKGPQPEIETIISPLALPDFHLTYIKKLTDDTGILQHAKYTVPDFSHGYCLDDNARALLLCIMAFRQKGLEEALELMHTYLSFINYMQNEDGTFKNFLSFRREYLDEVGSEDSFGRTVWAIGYLIRFAPNDAYFQIGLDIFLKAVPNFKKLKTLRGIAYTIIGIVHFLRHNPTDTGMLQILEELTSKIISMYENNKDTDWLWFEPLITYANGIIPLALLHSYEITENKNSLKTAKEAMDFLTKSVFRKDYLTPVGSDNWYKKGSEPSPYAQQAIDVMAMVLMYYQAYFIMHDSRYAQLKSQAFMWFLGENEFGIPLYDFETHGCCDGLEHSGVNNNQGAESTLAYHIAHLTVLLAHE
jgi:glycosyltransferase involved in cell wall biosynthesis